MLWSEEQNIVLQHIHKKEFWILIIKCGNKHRIKRSLFCGNKLKHENEAKGPVPLGPLASFSCLRQSRTQSNACARARKTLALGKLTTGTLNLGVPVPALLINVKPITAQEKFNFPRVNAFLACAQALLWERDCVYC